MIEEPSLLEELVDLAAETTDRFVTPIILEYFVELWKLEEYFGVGAEAKRVSENQTVHQLVMSKLTSKYLPVYLEEDQRFHNDYIHTVSNR